MTARETRLALLAFLMLAVGLATNMLVFQNAQHVRSRAQATGDARVTMSERARRLSLGPMEAASTPGANSSPSSTSASNSSTARAAAPGTAALSSLAVPTVLNATPAVASPPVIPGIGSADAESVDTIRAIQRELKLKGYHPGIADGVPGLLTRAAIMAFEHDQGLPLTGEATDRVLKALLLGFGSGRGQGAPLPLPSAGAQSVIRTVQQTLLARGYAIDRVDGRIGPDTARAIRAFEADWTMPETGRVSGALMAQLGKTAGAAGRGRSK